MGCWTSTRGTPAEPISSFTTPTCVHWGWNTLGPIALRRGMANYELMRLLRSVGTIHLDGRISATIPVGVETLRLDGLQTGLVAEGKKARVRVDRFQSSSETAAANPRLAPERKYWLSLTVQGDKYIPIAVVALNKAGEAVKISKYPIDTSYYRSRIEPGPGTSSPVEHSWHYDLDDEPESLIVKAFVELAFVEFPVQLEADLRRSEEQPVEPIPLQFSGSAPLQIEVLAPFGGLPLPRSRSEIDEHIEQGHLLDQLRLDLCESRGPDRTWQPASDFAPAHPRNRRPAAARPQGVDGRDQGHGFQRTEECDLGHGHPESRLLRRWHDLEAHCGGSQERSAAVIFSMTRFSIRETSVVFRSAK